jgi:hypothetical protein
MLAAPLFQHLRIFAVAVEGVHDGWSMELNFFGGVVGCPDNGVGWALFGINRVIW